VQPLESKALVGRSVDRMMRDLGILGPKSRTERLLDCQISINHPRERRGSETTPDHRSDLQELASRLIEPIDPRSEQGL